MQLEIRHLSKKYGSFYALKDFTVTLTEGIYGILGPNGAGKSTLMNLLTDNLERTEGEILADGEEILSMGERYRALLGYMPQQQGFYEQFSAGEFLGYIGRLKGLKGKQLKEQTDQLLKKVHLYENRDQVMSSFSGGMRQRVLLAQALLGDPKLLILDEPTAGLDPKERINIRNLIAEISTDKVILLATHVVSDIECIANEMILMKKGECVKMGTPAALIHSIQEKVAECPCTREQLLQLQEKYHTGNTFQRQDGLHFRIVCDALPDGFYRTGENLSLEEVYLYYLGEDIQQDPARENI